MHALLVAFNCDSITRCRNQKNTPHTQTPSSELLWNRSRSRRISTGKAPGRRALRPGQSQPGCQLRHLRKPWDVAVALRLAQHGAGTSAQLRLGRCDQMWPDVTRCDQGYLFRWVVTRCKMLQDVVTCCDMLWPWSVQGCLKRNWWNMVKYGEIWWNMVKYGEIWWNTRKVAAFGRHFFHPLVFLTSCGVVAVTKLRPGFLKCWKWRGSPTPRLKRIGTLNDMLKSSYIIVAIQNMNGTPWLLNQEFMNAELFLSCHCPRSDLLTAPCPGAVPIFAERCHGVMEDVYIWATCWANVAKYTIHGASWMIYRGCWVKPGIWDVGTQDICQGCLTSEYFIVTARLKQRHCRPTRTPWNSAIRPSCFTSVGWPLKEPGVTLSPFDNWEYPRYPRCSLSSTPAMNFNQRHLDLGYFRYEIWFKYYHLDHYSIFIYMLMVSYHPSGKRFFGGSTSSTSNQHVSSAHLTPHVALSLPRVTSAKRNKHTGIHYIYIIYMGVYGSKLCSQNPEIGHI